MVRGEKTRRQWLRWVHDAGRPAVRDLTEESDLRRPALPEDLGLGDERALRALMRAVNEPGLQQQVQALSEAWESYVAGVEVAELFSKAQRKELRELAPDWLNPAPVRDVAVRPQRRRAWPSVQTATHAG